MNNDHKAFDHVQNAYLVDQDKLGLNYQKGDGAAKSSAESTKRLLLAAEKGNVDAMLALGIAYRKGLAVPSDLILAVKWFYLATANNCVGADRHLRYLRRKLESAAKLKNAEAMYHLGAMFYNGYGVKQDLGWGFAWFRLAYEYFPAGSQKSLTLAILCAVSEDMSHDDNKRASRAKARIENNIAQLGK